MNRTCALTAVMIAALVVAFFSGASTSPGAKPVDEKKPDEAKPAAARPQIAVFNMAAVMRDFNQAKYQVWLLNTKKAEKSKQLSAWRAEYTKLQADLKENPNHPDKDETGKKMLELTRKIEDEDRKLNKELNDEASVIISDLYDKIKAAVDKTAEMNGYKAVFAYPDAVTETELQSPYIKELKLKPPAAQPFYVSADIDITRVVIKTLNSWYPPIDKATGKPVDISNLPAPPAAVPDTRPMQPILPSGLSQKD